MTEPAVSDIWSSNTEFDHLMTPETDVVENAHVSAYPFPNKHLVARLSHMIASSEGETMDVNDGDES